MTPGEHREKAIGLLEEAARGPVTARALALAEAQVHATLSRVEPEPVVVVKGADTATVEALSEVLLREGPSVLAVEHGVDVLAHAPNVWEIRLPASEPLFDLSDLAPAASPAEPEPAPKPAARRKRAPKKEPSS